MLRRARILFLAALLAACGGGAAPEEKTIRIGVGGPMTGNLAQFGMSLLNGATLAAEELNASGGLLGKPVELVADGDDQGNVEQGITVARNFARDGKIPVVLGHFNSGISTPAGKIYNDAGIVMVTPASTNPAVTSPDRPFVFRNLPTDDQNGEKLADFVVGTLGKKILLIYANNPYGKGLADFFRRRAEAIGGEILDVSQYDPDADEDFRSILTRWKGLGGEVIVITGEQPKAAQFILQAREVGLHLPVAGGDGLASSELWDIGKDASLGTYVVSYFDPGNPDTAVQDFVSRFTARFHRPPDVWAAQAYDAMRLVGDAIQRAGSAEPDRIREALAATEGWQGITGLHRFENGNCVGKQVIVTTVAKDAGGHFRFAYHSTLVAQAASPAAAAADTAPAPEAEGTPPQP